MIYINNTIPGCFLLILFLFSLGACASDDDFGKPAAIDFSLERIDRFLADGDHLQALPLIVSRERNGSDVGDRYSRAVDALKEGWQAARDREDWLDSLVYMRSFEALGITDFDMGLKELDLFVEGATQYIKEKKVGAAATLVQGNLGYDDLSDKQRRDFASVFRESGYYFLSAFLEGSDVPDAPEIERRIDGTVTIWVNRGMRLVGNMGVPDRGIGSGFFIDPEGYILTNYHVIASEVDPAYEGYSRLYIKIDDESGERIPAKVIGWDKNFDLALLKTEMDVPYVFGFSRQDSPELGERVAAIGSPGGLTRTLTSGTVSAYARSIQPMAGSLQIDVPINQGNSGGPLLNEKGEVIGIVFAGIQEYEGINFAIPGPYALRLIPSLYQGGPIELPWLGVSAWDNSGYIEVTYVVPGSPAAGAGLNSGDIIRSIDGKAFTDIRAVQEYLITRLSGTLTRLLWERDGIETKGIAALGVRPEIPMRVALDRDARENLLTPLFGFAAEGIGGGGLYKRYRINTVLFGSIADEVGFSKDDTFFLRKWEYIEEYDALIIQVILSGRKAGFIESAFQLGALLNISTVF